MLTHKKKLAFSLIEVSVVIIIIGFLLVGISKSRLIIINSRLTEARYLTLTSPVMLSRNVLLWWETTSEQSFDPNQLSSSNNPNIGVWNDISGGKVTAKNATQTDVNKQPQYIENAINSLPVLRFDGSGDYLDYSANELINSDYSIFVVEQRRSNKSSNYFIGGTSAAVGANSLILLGYSSDNQIWHNQISNGYRADVNSYSNPIPVIHSFRFSSVVGKNYYSNGVIKATCVTVGSNPICVKGLASYPHPKIGVFITTPSSYFNGDIGEIIIYNKYLNDTERLDVEKYLSKKWKIKIL